MTNEKTLREAPVGKLIASLSLPMILVMIIQMVYNLADIFFLGRYGNALQVAAVSLSSPIFSLFSAVNTLAGFGGCTAASLALGRGEKEKVRQISSFVFWFSLTAGFLIAALSLMFMDPLVHFLGADAETMGYAREYLKFAAANAVFAITGGAFGNTLRADGDSTSLVIASLSGTFLNIALDPLFIAVFGWGVTGAGLATLLGNTLACAMLIPVVQKKTLFSLSLRDLRLEKDVSLTVLSLGLPMAASTFLMTFSSLFSNRLFVSYGNTALAANGVAGKAGMLIGMMLLGISMGIQPAVSYTYGAGMHKRLRKIVNTTAVINTGGLCHPYGPFPEIPDLCPCAVYHEPALFLKRTDLCRRGYGCPLRRRCTAPLFQRKRQSSLFNIRAGFGHLFLISILSRIPCTPTF